MADSYIQGVALRPVLDLAPGDLVDLQGDAIADPVGHAGGGSPAALEFQFLEVEAVQRETPDCVCVYFTDWNPCGFPVDHRVEVDPEQTSEQRAAGFAAIYPKGRAEYLDACQTLDGESI